MIHRGYEITETGMDGDMIRFEYHGKTAYVAEYCCKLLKQEPAKKTEPAQREAVIEVKKSESDRASNTIQDPPLNSKQQQQMKKLLMMQSTSPKGLLYLKRIIKVQKK